MARLRPVMRGPSTLEPRFGEPDVCQGARALQFRLEQVLLRVEEVGARGDAGRETLLHDAPGLGGAFHRVERGGT